MKTTAETIALIRTKLLVMEATSLSDAEIERCLKDCVLAKNLIAIAKECRDDGSLTLTE